MFNGKDHLKVLMEIENNNNPRFRENFSKIKTEASEKSENYMTET